MKKSYKLDRDTNVDVIELLEIDSEFCLEYDTEMQYKKCFNSEREYRELRFE
jgi:hypothetical protein